LVPKNEGSGKKKGPGPGTWTKTEKVAAPGPDDRKTALSKKRQKKKPGDRGGGPNG